MSQGVVVLVDDGRDGFVRALQALFAANGVRTRLLQSTCLASVALTLDSGGARLHDAVIDVLVFHARPNSGFSRDFVAGDQDFCDQETKALWLAVLSSGVTTLNKPDAEIWYTRSEWSAWHRRLQAADVDTAELRVGDIECGPDSTWLPWGGGAASPPGPAARRAFAPAQVTDQPLREDLVVYGRPIRRSAPPVVEAAAKLLRDSGTNLATVVTDNRNRVAGCTAFPTIGAETLAAAAELAEEGIVADLYRRR